MSILQKTLESLNQVFAQLDLGWYVFGAQALNVYGMPRMTADIDVTIEPPAKISELIDNLTRAGFKMRVDDPYEFAEMSAVIPVVSPHGFPVDVVVGHSGLERQILSRARLHTVGDVEIPVATPEDLVISKLLAGRPKDLEDVRNLKSSVELEEPYIREILSQLEQALGVSDLLQAYERL